MKESEENPTYKFPVVCRRYQCLFCLGDEMLTYRQRVFEYVNANKMMNAVEKHLASFASEDNVSCPHPQCKAAGLVLPTVTEFKNHAANVHEIFLRP